MSPVPVSEFLIFYLSANLLVAGIAHALDRQLLMAVLRAQGLAGRRGIRAIGNMLAPFEMLAGALLVCSLAVGAVAMLAAVLASVLCTAMAIWVGVLKGTGYSGECGCGLGGGALSWHSVLRSVSLSLSGILLIYLQRPGASAGADVTALGPLLAGAAAGIGCALVAAMVCKAWAQVQELESELLHEHRVTP